MFTLRPRKHRKQIIMKYFIKKRLSLISTPSSKAQFRDEIFLHYQNNHYSTQTYHFNNRLNCPQNFTTGMKSYIFKLA